MFKGTGVVLKRRMAVGHGRISGIARLGKQAEVGQLILLHQPGSGQASRAAGRTAVGGVQCH